MSSPPSPASKLLPWGRLVLLAKKKGEALPDLFDLSRSMHRIGRVPNRSDLIIPKKYISTLHCIIRLHGKDNRGEPIADIEDASRYGLWVNRKKVGIRRKVQLKKGYVIHFADPDTTEVSELAYKFEILPSGLTKKNEELHAQLSADEKSVAGRTRKRVHEELQATQSPTKVVVSPPRPRPVKKLRRVTITQQLSQEEDVSEPDTEPSNTSATQQAASSSGTSTIAAGKRRRRAAVPAPDSKLAEKHDELLVLFAENSLTLKRQSKQLEQAQQELETLRKEHEAMKKTREDEVKKVKEQAATDRAKKDAETKQKLDEIRHERDVLKKTLHQILDQNSNVRPVVELTAELEKLKRQIKAGHDELAFQNRQRSLSQTTPPSKKQLVQLERWTQEIQRRQAEQEMSIRLVQQLAKHIKGSAVQANTQANLSGSSESQDSIDAAHPRSDRRNSQLSNEQSEISPSDVPLTVDAADEETKSGDAAQERPPLFTIFGARSSTADSSSSESKPATLSKPQFFRTQGVSSTESNESKTQEGAEDDETKGNE
ncbi:forkhead-associated domain-containing protein [Phytophthora infestans]|uniref:Forkhead-associated domain-containing protein n=1 Tax=Phytophthora infestans TaxID=4787 RepID=A0A833W5T3_PHYIN|nr:forkhead-associated domain-containing protein [Phytophthora infestans]